MKPQKRGYKQGICDYHLCNKKTRVYKCDYCGDYFCKEHIKSKPPGMPNFSSTKREDVLKREEWEKKGGHPCPEFYDYWKAEKKMEEEEYERSLDRLIKSKPIKREPAKIGGLRAPSLDEIWGHNKPRTKAKKYNKPFYYSKRRNRIKRYTTRLIVIGILGYLLYLGIVTGTIQNFFDRLTETSEGDDGYSGITTIQRAITKPEINIESLEKEIHDLINIEREKNGLSPMKWNSILNTVARKHSEDMAERDYFDHDSPEGHDFSYRYMQEKFNCRVAYGGYIYSGAENIFQNNLYDTVYYTNGIPTSYDWNTQEEIAESTVRDWMYSEGHRENILEPFWKSEGIGVAISDDDEVLITENFC